jgi:hypothetical protein
MNDGAEPSDKKPQESVSEPGGPLNAVPLVDVTVLPSEIVRVAKAGRTWGMRRRFDGYAAVSQDQLSVRGAAPKFIVRSLSDPSDWYIVKAAESWGAVESLTELLNNMLGKRLGFPMAHAGLLRADGELRFASHNFQAEGETLIHGSVLFREVFEDDLDGVGKKKWDEQRTYDLVLIRDVLERVCGEHAERLFAKLIEMLVFDALIGSMDRHMQNWGVLATVTEPRTYRFAPIFDSARALLWNCDEAKLNKLANDQRALEGYITRSHPKIGKASLGRPVNHFELIQHLIDDYPGPTREALDRVKSNLVRTAARVVREFPFNRAFSAVRKSLITKVLAMRADKLATIAGRKEVNDVANVPLS